MQQQHPKSENKIQDKNLKHAEIASFIILFFPSLGGVMYLAGSIVYWPSLTNVNSYAGGTLFTIGSILFILADIAGSYLQPEFSILKLLCNIGSFRACCSLIGNLAFMVGSVYFLPHFPVIVGEDLFIIGSIFQFIPQILCIWAVCSLNVFTAPFYVKMVKFKKTLVYANLFLAAGCFCFFIGTQLFISQNSQSQALFEEGVLLFIMGSFCFVVAPLLTFKMRKIRIVDPLSKYHDQIYVRFLPKKYGNSDIRKEKFYKNQQKEFIILQMDPSITPNPRLIQPI